MEKNMEELFNRFSNLKNKGFVEAINRNKNSSGLTLEHYLGTTSGDFCIPDFKNIEIKCININSNSKINLFTSTPDGSIIFPTQYLANHYGYPDNDYKNINVFRCLLGKNWKKIGKYYFIIVINYQNRKIYLNIYNEHKSFLNNYIYWDFDSIKEKLTRKLSQLAIITSKKMEKYGKTYYFYNDIKFYKLKSFDVFLFLLENGVVKIQFNIGVYKSGYKKGKIHDHGAAFVISRYDILKLFYLIK